jgi:hypothetical protein
MKRMFNPKNPPYFVIPDARSAIRNPGGSDSIVCPWVPGSAFGRPGMTMEGQRFNE